MAPDESSDSITRRRLLGSTGATVPALAVAGCGEPDEITGDDDDGDGAEGDAEADEDAGAEGDAETGGGDDGDDDDLEDE